MAKFSSELLYIKSEGRTMKTEYQQRYNELLQSINSGAVIISPNEYYFNFELEQEFLGGHYGGTQQRTRPRYNLMNYHFLTGTANYALCLNLFDTGITDEELAELLETIKRCPNLAQRINYIDLAGNNLTRLFDTTDFTNIECIFVERNNFNRTLDISTNRRIEAVYLAGLGYFGPRNNSYYFYASPRLQLDQDLLNKHLDFLFDVAPALPPLYVNIKKINLLLGINTLRTVKYDDLISFINKYDKENFIVRTVLDFLNDDPVIGDLPTVLRTIYDNFIAKKAIARNEILTLKRIYTANGLGVELLNAAEITNEAMQEDVGFKDFVKKESEWMSDIVQDKSVYEFLRLYGFSMFAKDINAVHPTTKHTPLTLAIDKGYTALAKRLVTVAAADVNAPNGLNNTPLHMVADKQDVKTGTFLLSYGAQRATNKNWLNESAEEIANRKGFAFSLHPL